MTSDPLWLELTAIELRKAATFDPARFGRCPICRLGATEVFVFPPLTWPVCDRCGVRWCVGRVLNRPRGREAIAFHIASLASYAAVPEPASDGPAAPVLESNCNRTRIESMQTTKRTITIHVPTAAALIATLTPREQYPPLVEAETDLADLRRRRELAIADVREREVRVEHCAVATVRGGDPVDHERAISALAAAKSMLPVFNDLVERAEERVAAARDIARDEAQAEARRRQEVLAGAARVLIEELREIERLEQVLAEAAYKLPTVAGAGLLRLPSVREELAVTR